MKKVVQLRKWSSSDIDSLKKLCNGVDRTYLSDRLPQPYTDADATWWLKMVEENEGKNGTFRAILVDEQIVGSISVERKADVYHFDAELGYMLMTDYLNRGIMTEAVRLICPVAFKELGLNRITANVYDANLASKRVLQKNGFLHEGTLRRAVIKNEIVYNLDVYGLLK